MEAILVCVALSLVGGLLMSGVAKKLGLPAVTAYLITGLLLGPYCLRPEYPLSDGFGLHRLYHWQ